MSDDKANNAASPDKSKSSTSNPVVVSDDSDSDDANIEDELKQQI